MAVGVFDGVGAAAAAGIADIGVLTHVELSVCLCFLLGLAQQESFGDLILVSY